MRYSHSFYLDFLGFLKNKFPTFYWGENEEGYYWGDTSVINGGFNTLRELTDHISNYLSLE
jgi:hypothetical protein